MRTGSMAMITTVLVAVPAAADVEHETMTIRGSTLMAWWQIDQDECVTISVNLWGGEQITRVIGEQTAETQQVYADLSRWDRCTDEYAYAAGESTTIAIDGLDTATVEIPVTLYQESRLALDDGGWACEAVVLDTGTLTATLTGYGDSRVYRHVQSYGSRTRRGMLRDRATFRDATATGSLVLEGAEVLTVDGGAWLSEGSAGTHTIVRSAP